MTPPSPAVGPKPLIVAGTIEARDLLVAAALALVAAAVPILVDAFTHAVSFDGAVVLEVACSLADGHGYLRPYGDITGFGHAIQTRAPFILPAAAIFNLFGVGVWQSQATNVLYLVMFSIALLALARRFTSWAFALLALAACLATPGMRDFGLNGYGEIPAFAWWLSGLAVLYGGDGAKGTGWGRVFVAGLLFGVAIVTKTVLAIGFVAVVPVWCVQAYSRSIGLRRISVLLVVLAAALLLPALIHELAHAYVIHDLARLHRWLDREWHAIGLQSGTAAGLHDTPDRFDKIATHFGILAAAMQIKPALLLAWLVALVPLIALVWPGLPRGAARPLLATLIVFAALYFIWWLAITPTAKAWHRRIFNGTVALELVSVIAIASAASMAWRSRLTSIGAGVAAFLVAVPLVFADGAALIGRGDPFWTTKTMIDDELAAIAKLPANAKLYGVGWYSAPTVGLYSGRRIHDLLHTLPATLESEHRAYVVLDRPAQKAGVAGYWVGRYAHRDVFAGEALRIVELDTDRLTDPFAGVAIDAAKLRGYADFSDGDFDDSMLFGFHEREGSGWRWVSADAELLLLYRGEDSFKLDLYVPDVSRYAEPGGVGISVWFGSCRLGRVFQDHEGRMSWWLPARNCPLEPGSVVRARIVSDNLMRTHGVRPLAFVADGLGFDTTLVKKTDVQRGAATTQAR